MTSTMTTKQEIKDNSLLSVFIASIIFHVIVFIIIPVSTKILWRKKAFVRPKTFHLVTIPTVLSEPKKKNVPYVKQEPKPRQSKPVPQTQNKKNAFKPEDLSELEDLLGGMQEPVSDINFAKAFPYSWYERNIMNKVERHWKPPVKDANISVLVSFFIYSNGSISNVSVKKSSGNGILDNMAIRAVTLAAPFGKLPPGYSGNKLEIDYTLKPTVK